MRLNHFAGAIFLLLETLSVPAVPTSAGQAPTGTSSGTATPATYEVNGRQYVVIAAGGGRDPKSSSGGVYVAFALP